MLTLNPDLKKLFVYVNFNTNGTELTSAIAELVRLSNEKYKDRIFFLENTGEIISHGHKFGVSDEVKSQIAALQTESANLQTSVKALTGLANVPATAKEVTISDTSVIGEYVHTQILKNKTIVAAKENSGITVEAKADGAGTTTYTVGLDQSVIVDGKTIVTDGGKLKTAVKLVKKYCADKTPTVGSTFYDSKTVVPADTSVHPVILLTDNAGAILDIVDGNEFVTDGMLDTVTYDDKEGTLTFTWNTDSGRKESTSIDIKKIFQIENIHTQTPDYITVDKEIPGQHGDAAKLAYHVDAKVDATNLTAMSTVTYTPGTPATGSIVDAPLTPAKDAIYATNYANDDALANALGNVSGLADANKVAAKIAQIDKDIVKVGNDAIAREKTITTGIDAKIADLQQKLNEEATARGDMDAKLYGEAIPEAGPVNTIKKNTDAIAILNGADDVAGSVAQKIKELKEKLDAEVTYQDEHELVKVAISQVDGVVVAKDNAVTVKTDTLTVSPNENPEYENGSLKFSAKDFNTVAASNPSLVTNQDAWVYGQCIKAQAIKAINSDDNEYIKIVREDNKTKIKFEPWAEVHTVTELADIDKI